MRRSPMKTQAGQTIDEMAAQLEASSAGNRLNRQALYPEAAATVKKEALAQIVNQQRDLLRMTKERGRRIDLDSVDEVEACVNAYLDSCVKANVFPTMMGFAAAAGWSRMSIYRYIHQNRNESARYLDNLRSSWAAIMAQMALSRQASEATAIFLLKNAGQDLSDRVELTAVPVYDNGKRELTVDEIAERYMVETTDSNESSTMFNDTAITNEDPTGGEYNGQ